MAVFPVNHHGIAVSRQSAFDAGSRTEVLDLLDFRDIAVTPDNIFRLHKAGVIKNRDHFYIGSFPLGLHKKSLLDGCAGFVNFGKSEQMFVQAKYNTFLKRIATSFLFFFDS